MPCQGPSLGIDVRLFDFAADPDPADSAFFTGHPVPPGTPGELVAANAFPNVPCFFWNDPGSGRVEMAPASSASGSVSAVRPRSMILHADRPAAPPGSRNHDAYFARFRHVWAHGDFCVVRSEAGGQLEFLGRADGVLNPSGVRFGSAEIYAVIERYFADRVADTLCVGQRRPGRDSDEARAIYDAIARDLSKRHVPRHVFTMPAIPTTINMKKVELPVKRIVCGHRVVPSGTLANPESLQFADIEPVLAAKSQSCKTHFA